MTRCVLALDQGTTSSRAILFDRRGRPSPRPRRSSASTIPARAGWSTSPRTSGTRRAASRWPSSGGPAHAGRRRGRRDREPEGDDPPLGQGTPAAPPPRDRLAGPAHRRGLRRARAPGPRAPLQAEDRPPAGPVFLGHQARMAPGPRPGARRRAARGELAFGTVDTWLLWKLTSGRVHATDVSNASRTLLAGLRTGDWEAGLARALRIPMEVLPEIRPSSGVFGEIDGIAALRGVPVAGIAGDQQAALFGQGCFSARDGQEHLRDRVLHAHEHRRTAPSPPATASSRRSRGASAAARSTPSREASSWGAPSSSGCATASA
jgi:glycerol kinase